MWQLLKHKPAKWRDECGQLSAVGIKDYLVESRVDCPFLYASKHGFYGWHYLIKSTYIRMSPLPLGTTTIGAHHSVGSSNGTKKTGDLFFQFSEEWNRHSSRGSEAEKLFIFHQAYGVFTFKLAKPGKQLWIGFYNIFL